MAYIDFNDTWDLIVIAQGTDVAPGMGLGPGLPNSTYSDSYGPFRSELANGAGVGGVGHHPSMGYRHKHLLYSETATERNKRIRAMISMSCQRHGIYYGPDAEVRYTDTLQNGKPYGPKNAPIPWVPNLPNDMAQGPTAWPNPTGVGIIAWAPMGPQFSWSMLPSVMEIFGETIPFLPSIPGYATWDAGSIAKARLEAECDMLAGMMGHDFYQFTLAGHNYAGLDGWIDRIAGTSMGFFTRALQKGALNGATVGKIVNFIQGFINFYSYAPGAARKTNTLAADAPYTPGMAYIQPHELAWVGAAAYDASKCFDPVGQTAIITSLENICIRIGQWIADVIPTAAGPTQYKAPRGVFINDNIVAGDGAGLPVASLTPYLGVDCLPFYITAPAWSDYEVWCYRALECAGQLGVTDAATRAASINTLHEGTADYWRWLVNADWTYEPAAAKTAAGE